MAEPEIKAFLFALGDYSRFTILSALAEREMNVSEIVDVTGIKQSNVSHHMTCLMNCGFVNVRKEGKMHVYSLNKNVKPMVESMLAHIKNYKKRILSCNIASRDYVLKVIK
ncbi:MAG: metalloregulator ArsR/SmtB family transcription factor [Candidatus Micrarchaeaceae archaeon]